MREITGAEQIRWQRQAATLLGNLLALAAKQKLPPINWSVQSAGASVHGEVLSHPHSVRREQFGAWKAAITAAAGRPPDHDNEHTSGASGAETRLVCGWKHLPVTLSDKGTYPSAGVTLSASIWPDEEEGTDG